jgi:rod shape-determining protein MreD
MKVLFWPILTLLLYTLQSSWFLFFNTTQAPDFLLIMILLVALNEGAKGGAIAGLAIGALQDVVTFTFFGYHLITRMAIGLVVGLLRGNIFKDSLPTFLVLVALSSILLKGINTVFLVAYHKEFFNMWPIIYNTLKYIGWNVVVAIPLWIAAQVFAEVLRRRQHRYYEF